MRCVSLSIGIADYAHEFFRRSENRLKFAAEDATAFHRYCTTAWGGAGNRHDLLRDREATESSLYALSNDLRGIDQIDLLLLYLSGHGELGVGGSRGWFCLADARPAVESMGGPVIDSFLATMAARRAVLVIDCCYAEAVVAGTRYFSSLTEDSDRLGAARVFAASARSDQRSWEDDTLRRSVFSDVLLRGLSTISAASDPDGYVDYDSRLVPLLREQVPLQVAARKRGLAQEPVFGGVAAVAIRLPTVTMASLGRELTVFETVRRRVMQLAVFLVAGLVLGVLAIDAVGYHLTTTGTGRIVVRPGLAETYQLLPFHLRPQVDTGLSLADINPTEDEFLTGLSRSSIVGFATHLDDQALRPWLGAIEPFLRPQQQAAWSALARGTERPLDPENFPPPLLEAAFLSVHGGVLLSEVGGRLYPLKPDAEIECISSDSTKMDFTVLDPAPMVFRSYVRWVASTALQGRDALADAAVRLTKYSSHRSLHAKIEQEQIWELRTFAGGINLLMQRAPGEALSPGRELDAMATRQAPLALTTVCGGYAGFAEGLVGAGPKQRQELEMVLLSSIAASYETDGEAVPSPDPELAAVALQELAYAGQLSVPTMSVLDDLVRAHDLAGSGNRPAFDLLRAIAPVQPLPARLKDALLRRLEDGPIEEFDFLPLECFRLLASNYRYLTQNDIGRLKNWAAAEQPNQYTMSDFHAGLGFLALASPASSGGLSPEQIDLLLGYLSPASRFPAEATTYSGTTVIAATADEAIVALGRALQSGQRLSEEAVEQLANIAQGRPDLAGRPALVAGLAASWYADVAPARLAGRIAQRLTMVRSDSAWRALEAEAAATMIVSKSADVRAEALKSLGARWDDEIEPELRRALAVIIALSTLPRVGDLGVFAFEEPL